MRLGAEALAAVVLLGTGCCRRPASPLDVATIDVLADGAGIVVLVDRRSSTAMCTGAVIGSRRTGGDDFATDVLTASHCVASAANVGIELPPPGASATSTASSLLPVEVVLRSDDDEVSGSSERIDWVDDWVILRARGPWTTSALPLFDGDPNTAIPRGATVQLVSYHDRVFFNHGTVTLSAHAHSFPWRGVPPSLVQAGHSGAPIMFRGQVVAVFSGSRQNSRGCQLLCGSEWPEALRLTSVAEVRDVAHRAGVRLE